MSLSRTLVALVALSLALAFAIWRPPMMREVDLRVYDALVRGDAGAAEARPRSLVVAIDETSLARVGQWPWPRSVLATLVEQLHTLGATVVALDVLLPEAERAGKPNDRRLADALQRGPAVTGYAFLFDHAGPATACTVHPLELVERQRGDTPPSAGLFTATAGVCATADLASAASGAGFINAAPDPDGLLRRAPLLLRFGDRVYPSLALAAARRAFGAGPVVLDARSDGSMTMTVASRTVSLDPQGRLLLRLPPAGQRLPAIPAADVLDGLVQPEQVRGRLVFIGATAPGLRDVVVTAVDRALPGVAVHAAVADTLMGGAAYERSEFAPLMEIAGTAFLTLLTSVLITRAGLLTATLATAVVGAIVWFGCGWLLSARGLWFSPLYPLAGMTLAVACEGMFAVMHGRRRTRAFSPRHWRASRDSRRC